MGLISWVPPCTTGMGWALRVGFQCFQPAQRPLDAPWGCLTDCTMPMGSTKARMVLRVPLSAFSKGKARTLQQGDVMGLSMSATWNGARVQPYLVALVARCGWPSHVVRDGGSASKQGIVETFLAAPTRAAWSSDVPHCGAHGLQHSSAQVSLFQQFQTLGTRMRQRLQQTQCAFVLPPKARATGRLLGGSRQAAWGLRTIASVEEKARAHAPEASTLA